MNVRIESLLEGAARATGAVVVIDVFRAFTTAAVALAHGAERIIMVGGVEEALSLRSAGIAQICIGEVRGRRPADFEFGNSPARLIGVDLSGKTIAQRTSAGTQGIVTVRGAERLYAGSLVTARATARALLAQPTAVMTLVAMGKNGDARTDEDELCALHLRNLLEGRDGDPDAVRRVILAGGEAPRFHAPADPDAEDPADLEVALDVDRYDFAVRVGVEDGRPVARMERA
jgi:2-phosphosulfolactate phosphatase